jgi:hypothetical protein
MGPAHGKVCGLLYVLTCMELASATASTFATGFARSEFDVSLDGTEESVDVVESILDYLHDVSGGLTEEAIDDLALGFGSYVGDVFREMHGGRGFIAFEDGDPWIAKARQRIVLGPDESIARYYRSLVVRMR